MKRFCEKAISITTLLFSVCIGGSHIYGATAPDFIPHVKKSDITFTPLHPYENLLKATFNGDLNGIKYLIEQKHEDVNSTNQDGVTPLMIAVQQGRLDIVTYLLGHNRGYMGNTKIKAADANLRDSQGANALMVACLNGNLGIVKRLAAKTNIDETNNEGSTALMAAAWKGHADVVTYLLNPARNANVNLQNEDGYTALIIAATSGHTDVVEALLKNKNTEVNKQDAKGLTALLRATAQENLEVVEALLRDDRTDVNKPDGDGISALIAASYLGNSKIVNVLLQHSKIEINQPDNDGNTALMAASSEGYTDIVNLLLADKDTKINLTNSQGLPALVFAVQENHPDVVQALVTKGANTKIKIPVKLQTEDGTVVYDTGTVLMIATGNGNLEIVKTLVEQGKAKVNVSTNTGLTALIIAEKAGHTEIANYLRAHMGQ